MIAVGGILGWLASILGRADDARGIALNIGVGVIAALIAGALSSEGSLLVGVSPTALLLALVISAAVLGGFNVARGALSR